MAVNKSQNPNIACRLPNKMDKIFLSMLNLIARPFHRQWALRPYHCCPTCGTKILEPKEKAGL